MISKLDTLLEFVSFTHEVRKIKRSVWVADEEQFENDSEHSYQVALTALYIIESERLELNPYRAMGLALMHDILEVHSGDTPIFAEGEVQSTKAQREMDAIEQLRKDWPQMPLMMELIDEYEARQTPESKFIYALDKLLPIVNNYLDNGRNWKHNAVSLKQLVAAKQHKVAGDDTIKYFYDQLITILKKRPDLFVV